ncbi:acyltransferase family protein [Paraburkholderia sacchari]|uniref:acyltransferase family protein n=1 Tax=Paraburkholderia sacchari TaxID=159450 RepID=UPI003D962073
MPNGQRKNTDIECLRAIAIILVMMQHYRNRLPTPRLYYEMFDYIQPWAGVDLFLAISGYLVCKTLLEHLDRESISVALSNFWRRRAVRLLPAFVVWAIISVAVASIVSNDPMQGFIDAGKGAIVGLIGIANIYWTLCAQHGFTCVKFDYNSHFWSLALEWQLYTFLALSVAAFGARVAIFMFAIVAIIASLFPAPSFSWAWSLRPQAFFLGSFVCVVLRNRKFMVFAESRTIVTLRRGMLVLGVGVAVVSPALLHDPFVIPMVSIGAAIALLSALGAIPIAPRSIGPILEWVGARSYSIYLCHLSVIYGFRKVLLSILYFTNPAPVFTFFVVSAILIVVTFAASDLSYRFVEQPAINWLRGKPGRVNKIYTA